MSFQRTVSSCYPNCRVLCVDQLIMLQLTEMFLIIVLVLNCYGRVIFPRKTGTTSSIHYTLKTPRSIYYKINAPLGERLWLAGVVSYFHGVGGSSTRGESMSPSEPRITHTAQSVNLAYNETVLTELNGIMNRPKGLPSL